MFHDSSFIRKWRARRSVGRRGAERDSLPPAVGRSAAARAIASGSVLLLLASGPVVGELPPSGKHLGVATCASSTCHGRVTPADDADLALNEYFIWTKYDAHSDAYEVLKNERSRRIANNMGLQDPSSAPECLVCHADYVPEAQRGPQFQLGDGVGCEACHGGAENWIAFHYGKEVTHAQNLERGMWPTDDTQFLARLCQSCHVGDENRLASHEMMAAGHPRLRFELDTWLANMPPHHVVDADYRRRKGATSHVDRWAAGVAATARAYLQMLPAHINATSLFPELALFDCQACHRPMNFSVIRSEREKNLLPAGTVRPDDHSIRMLAIVVGIRDQQLAANIRNRNRALHQAASASTKVFLASAASLLPLVERAADVLQKSDFSASDRDRLRRALLHAASQGVFRDYADAEQLFLALQMLAVQNKTQQQNRYGRLFDLLSNPRAFSPQRIAAEAERLLK